MFTFRIFCAFRGFLCLIFLRSSFCLFAIAAPVTFQSSETQTSLLELYTSEGCSSCPPAETWLSRLKESPGLWKDFVPVAFHVDYWDYLGWRDPWASKPFSDRQRTYAKQWRSDSVYTPGFVLNGKEWRAWSRSKTVPASTARVGILRVTSTDLKYWDITFTPTAPPDQAYEVHAALLAGGLISDVKAGENRDRQLTHDFVVLNLVGTALKPKAGTFTGSFSLDPKPPQGSHCLAIWITRLTQSAPLQATGGRLPSAP